MRQVDGWRALTVVVVALLGVAALGARWLTVNRTALRDATSGIRGGRARRPCSSWDAERACSPRSWSRNHE